MNIKESIIKATTELIEENGGDLSAVTSRAIADRSGAALGLINYHFKSKDKLIEMCVQRIANKILFCFYSDDDMGEDIAEQEKVLRRAQKVFDFFFSNKAIARTFILGDLREYRIKSNTSAVQSGLKLAMQSLSGEKKRLLAFILTSVMETAFLTGDSSYDVLGYHLDNKLERDLFLAETVEMVYRGVQ